MDTIIWKIILQLVLIALNAVFACAEAAIISINDSKLELMADEGNKKAARLYKLAKKPTKFLTTIQIAITLAGFTGSAFAAVNFAGLLTGKLMDAGVTMSETAVSALSVIVITLILSYLTLLLGEFIPRHVATKYPEKIGFGLSAPIACLVVVFSPLVWLLTVSTNAVLRLFKIDPNDEGENITEEEIRMLVDVGSEKGTIDADEKEMIQNVFEFDDLTADEIATHRTDVAMLWLDESMEKWEKTIYETTYTHYPVCRETVDEVVGVLSTMDFLKLKDRSRENVLRKAVKPAYFVPHSVNADVLFDNMKESGNYFAVVIDEYGGVHGIITMMDLIEEIVGDFNSRSNRSYTSDIERIDTDTWRILGGADIDDVEKQLNIKLDNGEYDTFGGFVISALGYLPDDGQTVEIDADGLHINVVEVKDHRIVKTVVCRPEETE